MKILVTGGAGYIGSVTAAALVGKGHEVTVYDSLEKGHRDAVPDGARLVVGDLADGGNLERALSDNEIEAVMHFAAYSLVGESMRNPALYFINNISKGLILLESMRKTAIKKIVFSSSAAVYGLPESTPIPEGHPARPINPYGETKLCYEGILHRYHYAYGLEYVSLRYFNAAGATRELGEDHRPETHLIPHVLKAALGQEGSVRIFGEDYDTEDGTCVRDYIHVEDLAEAHILALACGGERIYNLGNGRGFSVRKVIEVAGKVTGNEIRAVGAPRRPGDPPVLVAGSEKIRRELGWEPRRPEIEEIIASSWRWMREHPEGYEK